jgi:hypothetical protein
MIDNDDVQHALSTLERFAPAEGAVLAGMRDGIVRRRKRRQIASVVGVAGMAAAVALGVVYFTPGKSTGGSGFAGPAAPPAPATSTPTPPAQPVLPFSVGWVPDGYSLEVWEAGSTDGSTQYSGRNDFQTVVVWVGANARDKRATATDEPTTIAGRSGVIRRFAEDTAERQFIWQFADGRWATVGGRVPTVPLASLRRVAESVAATPTPMKFPFTLASLPDGYQVTGWMGGDGNPLNGSMTLCRSAIQPRSETQAPDCVSLSVGKGTAPIVTFAKDSSTPNKQVEVPIDQEQTIDGVATRATADGTRVVAQLDAERWVQAFSQDAGADLLRRVAVSIRS